MGAITISRELGSLGTQIAREVSDRLGYRMVWREVINEAAGRAGAPEVALAEIDDLGLLGVKPTYRARTAYHQAVRQVLQELTAAGRVVIVGRAGQVILKDRADVLHVRIIAPLDLRAARIAARQQVSISASKAQIQRSDESRRCYLHRYHHVDWDDLQLYDLVISTAHLDLPAAAALIIQAWKAIEGAPAPGVDT